MPLLGILLVRYDRGRYGAALDRLRAMAGTLAHWDWRIASVDNKHETLLGSHVAPGVYEAGGDNRLHEFSGWGAARAAFLREFGRPDLWLLASDALGAYGDDHAPLLTDAALTFTLAAGAAAGLVDRPDPRYGPLEGPDGAVGWWLRTSFLILAPGAWESLGPLAAREGVEDVAGSGFALEDGRPRWFLPGAPLGAEYRRYLRDWLGRDWHSAFELGPETWERYRDKLRNILNEHALSIRLGARPVYDLRFLRAAAGGRFGGLEAVARRGWQPPTRQLDALRPGPARRAWNKAARLARRFASRKDEG